MRGSMIVFLFLWVSLALSKASHSLCRGGFLPAMDRLQILVSAAQPFSL